MCSSQNRFSAWFSLAVCNSCVFVQRCLPSHTSARITSALKWTPSVFGRHTHISAQALISVRPCAGLVVRSQRTLTARSEICASCEHIPSIPANTHTRVFLSSSVSCSSGERVWCVWIGSLLGSGLMGPRLSRPFMRSRVCRPSLFQRDFSALSLLCQRRHWLTLLC